MRKLLNTLYVGTQGTYLHKEGETIVAEQEKKRLLQIPLHTLQGLVCFGNVLVSPFLMGHCAEKGVSVSFLSEHGRFLASVKGPVAGNVLLRRQQYRLADDSISSSKMASYLVSAKLANARVVLQRSVRDHGDKVDVEALRAGISAIDRLQGAVEKAGDLDTIRGYEGMAAAEYFAVFNHLIVDQKEGFAFRERSRRPPLDAVNALLSFVYTLLAHDVRSALETVGLDPAVGFLHRDRPGRHGLALDLMEEFRPFLADRLVLSLINRRQVSPRGFTRAANGAVTMDADTRKTILVEYQNRKQDEITHPYIEEKVKVGLLFFLQANLMARYLRGDLDGYPPFFWR